jgi:transcriptional regulator with XRE-family HTH domain
MNIMKKPMYPKLVCEMAVRGETQSDLAKQLNLSIPAISNRFNGKTEWSITEIDAICKRYNKSYDELFLNDEN